MEKELIKKKEKGISIYLSLMIMFVLLSIALGMSLIIVSQIKMIRGIKDSIIAFSAANSGTELIMYQDKVCRQSNCASIGCTYILGCTCIPGCNGILGQTILLTELKDPDGSHALIIDGQPLEYEAVFSDGALDIRSTGKYKEIVRTVEVIRE